MTGITREELARRYAAGERNFSGADLHGDFSGMELSGADLSGARLAAIEAYVDAFSPAEKRIFLDRQVWTMVLEIEEATS